MGAAGRATDAGPAPCDVTATDAGAANRFAGFRLRGI